MNRSSTLRQTALAALIALNCAQGVNAQALAENSANAGAGLSVLAPLSTKPASPSSSQTEQAQATALTANEAKQLVGGNVTELQQLLRGSNLKELRTTYNGTYGASLQFYAKDMAYYVVLFQQNAFWRVIKTQDAARAELVYENFVHQTKQLSDIEIRRTRLAAQTAFTERMTALSQDHASRLQADLDVAHQQQSIVSNQQQLSRAEATTLAQQKASAQNKLRAALRQVHELQRQMDSGLPLH